MQEQERLNKTYQIIMQRMLDTGQAPHYTEIAAELDVPVEEGRQALHELFSAGFPGWLYPNTEYICSFPPFNNLPTQYRITIDGEQKWFGLCGFESLSVSSLVPGKIVRVDAPCLDCGAPLGVEMKNGKIIKSEPEEMVGYISVPMKDWFNDLPYACSVMNLFRSREHARSWIGFKPGTEEGIIPLSQLMKIYSTKFFTHRLNPDYAVHMTEYLIELDAVLKEMGSYWEPPVKWEGLLGF